MNGLVCPVCWRQLEFNKLPCDQQQIQLLKIVPERYIIAEIKDLHTKLQELFGNEIDNGVLLWGTAGAGKTYAMAALAKQYITEGFAVLRVHYEMLCLQIRDSYKPQSSQTEWGIIEPLLNCDKLFIEDVGVGRSLGKQESDHSTRTLQLLIDIRLERCRPTFITSNKSVENLTKSFDERIGDRLRLLHVFQMTARSKRKK